MVEPQRFQISTKRHSQVLTDTTSYSAAHLQQLTEKQQHDTQNISSFGAKPYFNINMPRQRKTKKNETAGPGCNSGCCPDHTFWLKPINRDPRDKLAVTMEFCPRRALGTGKMERTTPIFNRDGKEYTPGFFLEGEDLHYMEFDKRYKDAHNLRKLEYLDSNKTILEPKHGRKTKLCAVCRLQYEDYLQHINSKAHKLKIRVNTYNGFIEEMARDFSLQAEFNEESESTRQFEIEGKATKRIKRDQTERQRAPKDAINVFEDDKVSKIQEADWQKILERSFHVEDYLCFE